MTKCIRCGHDADELVTKEWTFVIDRDPPSLNARIFNAGPRRHLYRKERDLWCMEFRVARLNQKIPKATSRRRVTLTRLYTGRQKERDPDNLCGGMKAVTDALVHEALITDDSPACAEITYAQLRCDSESPGVILLPGLRVRIECVSGAT